MFRTVLFSAYLYQIASAVGKSSAEPTASPNGTLIPNPGGTPFPQFPTIDRSATYHLYAFDYQGNVVSVYDTKTGTLEQTTDYYPYGLPHATASFASPYDRNRRLYSGKELMTEAGLNTYDFAARWQSPAFPIFSTTDPLAEKTQSIGVYTFCGGDPINLTDPTGMTFRNESDRMLLISELNKRKDAIEIELRNLYEKKDLNGELSNKKDQKRLSELEKEIIHINQAISDVNLLADDPDHEYVLVQDDYSAHRVTQLAEDGSIYIQYSDLALAYHEISHIRQSLKSKGKLEFDPYSKELCSASRRLPEIARNEIEAYRIQFSFNNSSMPKTVGNIDQIDIIYLQKLRTPNGDYAYPYTYIEGMVDFNYDLETYFNY